MLRAVEINVVAGVESLPLTGGGRVFLIASAGPEDEHGSQGKADTELRVQYLPAQTRNRHMIFHIK